MLQNTSYVTITDNTGASQWMVFRVLKWSGCKKAWIWDLVVIAIKKADPKSSIEDWSVHRALIVRTKKWMRRKDWSYVSFSDNAVVLVTKTEKWEIKPIWKRVFGPVPRELRDHPQYWSYYKSIVNMAQEVI